MKRRNIRLATALAAALFSNSWAQTPDEVVQLSTQLSGMMLLEQLARLERENIL